MIGAYLRAHQVRKLQIGAGGSNLPGWLNTDIEPGEGQAYLDATQPIPVPDQSFTYIFSEHVIEHLSFEEGHALFKECFRILASGGRMRIATPNLLVLVSLFRPDKPPEMQDYIRSKLDLFGWPKSPTSECFIMNPELRKFGHQFVYDPGTLRSSLTAAGFRFAGEYQPGQSDIADLRGIDLRTSHGSAFETMTVEVVRP
jgi:SAM-dependent methyltransferase